MIAMKRLLFVRRRCSSPAFVGGLVVSGRDCAPTSPPDVAAAAERPAVAQRRARRPRRPARCRTCRPSPSARCRRRSTSRRRSTVPVDNPFFQMFYGDRSGAAADEPRLGRHRLGRRLHPDEQPRHRQTRDADDQGHAAGRPRAAGASSSASTPSPTWRSSRSTRQNLDAAAVGRLEQAARRRVGAGGRQSVRVQPDGHARHRLGRRTGHDPQLGDLQRLHPDRRGDQPGQLGRRARQQPRRARRHQHDDLQRDGRLPGHRLRDSVEPRAPDHGRADQEPARSCGDRSA